VVVDPAALRPESAGTGVFFGATVTYKGAAGLEHVVSIVGIDEVDLDRGYISRSKPGEEVASSTLSRTSLSHRPRSPPSDPRSGRAAQEVRQERR
jgi:hypothetical protein